MGARQLNFDLQKEERGKLVDYLQKDPLQSFFYLTSNGNLTFHWANWKETCLYQKSLLVKHNEQRARFKELVDKLDRLRESTIWLRSKQKTVKTTLYDLYESYLDPRMRITWFNRSDEILVSQVNEAGPYISLSSMRWYDKEIYTAFVYKKILSQKATLRNFRLGISLPVLCYFNQVSFDSTMGFIHQISKDGILFKIVGLNNFNRFTSSRTIRFEVDLTPFEGIRDKNVKQLMEHFSQVDFNDFSGAEKSSYILNATRLMDYYDNSLNCRASNGKDYYLFAKYDDFSEDISTTPMRETFLDLVKKIEDYFLLELKKKA